MNELFKKLMDEVNINQETAASIPEVDRSFLGDRLTDKLDMRVENILYSQDGPVVNDVLKSSKSF